MSIRFLLLGVLLLANLGQAKAQFKKRTVFGVQLKPMVPSKFFDTGPSEATNNEFDVLFTPRPGYNFGMIVRHDLTKMWSIETGITVVQRNYRMDIRHPLLPEPIRSDFRFVGYEIPIQALVYVQLSEKWWMNASGGLSLDMYPTDVESFADAQVDTLNVDVYQKTFRRNWLQASIMANYGFEYRTKKQGAFYVGASFHRPFQSIASTGVRLTIDNDPSNLFFDLSGSYLTVDLRYFFHEDPSKKKVPTRKGYESLE